MNFDLLCAVANHLHIQKTLAFSAAFYPIISEQAFSGHHVELNANRVDLHANTNHVSPLCHS